MKHFVYILLFLFIASSAYAQSLNHTYSGVPIAYEYRAEYNGSDAVLYEGWSRWKSSDADTADDIWRIGYREYTGTNLTHITFAGNGKFKYIWDDRSTYFAAPLTGSLLLSDDTYILLSDGGKITIQ